MTLLYSYSFYDLEDKICHTCLCAFRKGGIGGLFAPRCLAGMVGVRDSRSPPGGSGAKSRGGPCGVLLSTSSFINLIMSISVSSSSSAN